MKKATAGVIGFLVAALVPAIVFSVFSPAVERFDVVGILGWLLVFYFFSALATLLLGLPAFVLLNRLGMIRWWSALAVGLAGGAVIGIVLRWPNATQRSDVLVMASAGAGAALTFWLMWRAQRASPSASN